MAMQEHCLIIKGVPTRILTWGKGIGDKFEENEKLVLFIPGNPGVTKFYTEYLEEVHKLTGYSVWIIGHAGHEVIPSHHMPPRKQNDHLFGLEGQIDHKALFIQNYVPKQAKLFMMGHSIGAYIILNLLRAPSIKTRVLRSYLLFPTIENMAESFNGTLITKVLVYFEYLLYIFVFLFSLFPDFLQRFFVSIYCKLTSMPPRWCPVVKDFITIYTISNFSHMGMDEMRLVRARDNQVLQENIGSIKLYYGEKDGWVPLSYYTKIKEDIPGIDAEICDKGYDHAFVLRSSLEMAYLTAGWLKE